MQPRGREQRDERSLGELFGDLARELTTLLRQEVALARTEVGQTATRVGRDLGLLAVGGAVAYAGFLALLAALIIGLGQLGLEWWLAALIVGLVVAGVGYLLVRRGLTALRQEELVPQRTLETLREDAQLVKEQTR
jgi:hypothetical protein